MEATIALRDFPLFPEQNVFPSAPPEVALEGNRGSVDSSPHDRCVATTTWAATCADWQPQVSFDPAVGAARN